jgi:hypothetical protein
MSANRMSAAECGVQHRPDLRWRPPIERYIGNQHGIAQGLGQPYGVLRGGDRTASRRLACAISVSSSRAVKR